MITREFTVNNLTILVYIDYVDKWAVVFKLYHPDGEGMEVYEEILETATDDFIEAENLVSKVDEEYLKVLFRSVINQ